MLQAWDLSKVCHHQLRDSGQLTGGSAKGSSIRQCSYLQGAENDTGGCEQKGNLLNLLNKGLRRLRRLRLCKDIDPEQHPKFSCRAGAQGWHGSPGGPAPAECTAVRPGCWGAAGCSWKNSWPWQPGWPGRHGHRMEAFPAPASHSRPGVLWASGGPGLLTQSRCNGVWKSGDQVCCISVKGGRLSA